MSGNLSPAASRSCISYTTFEDLYRHLCISRWSLPLSYRSWTMVLPQWPVFQPACLTVSSPSSTPQLSRSPVSVAGSILQMLLPVSTESEVTAVQQHLETSYKNNCKERKTHTGNGARWWYPELEGMRKKCRKNIRKARRNQLDSDSTREERRKYKKAIRQSKRDSGHRFCNSVAGPRPAARLFKVLGKDHEIYIDNITLPDGGSSNDTGEVLRHLLDTHFPGNIPHTKNKNNSSHNQQVSSEDWNMAKKIVWAVSLFAHYKSPGIDGIFPVLLQKGLDILIETLVKIFRAWIAYGYIPVQWRTSRVVFVPKPGRVDYTLVKSFRPLV